MYFILKNDILLNTDIIINDPTDLPVELSFMKGASIITPIESPLIFTTNAKRGDIIRDFDDRKIPIVSKRFLEFLKAAGVENLQTFPIIIKSEEDDTIWDNYFAINILGLIQCANLEKSTFTEIVPGSIYSFRELAINAQKAKGNLLFRLQEEPGKIIVHKSVLKYIVDNDPDETLPGWEADDIIQ